MPSLFALNIGLLSILACSQEQQELITYEYPTAVYSSSWLDFGEVDHGAPEVRSFTIQNTGDLPMGVESIVAGEGKADNFTVAWDAANISCPETAEEDEGEEEAAAKLVGPPAAAISLDVTTLDFGTVVVGTPAFQTAVITNTGDEDLMLTSLQIVGAQGALFSLVGAYDGSTVLPGETASVVVKFDPIDASAASASLIIVSNADTAVVELPMVANDAVDTGDTGDTGDTSEPVDTGEIDDNVIFTLDKDCQATVDVTFDPVDVGQLYGSLIVTTTNEDVEDVNDATYFADFKKVQSIIYLEGEGVKGEGRLVVKPRTVDFGHVFEGEDSVRWIEVINAGDGDLTLLEPQLSENCDEAYEITWSYLGGDATTKLLEGGAQTLVEVTFTPVDDRAATCTVTIPSDDADNDEININLQGNQGADPTNVAPTVVLRSPAPGYIHTSPDPIPLELNVFDKNQPASTVQCRVKSAVQLSATIADCTPSDDSGHVFVDVPMEFLGAGADTFLIEVRDGSAVASYASLPLTILSSVTESDDDGDGYGDLDTGLLYDCNDANISTYPKAAEVNDADDNDCDGLVDEGTEGADDDGDSFSELDGDCDDANANTYPGAPEAPDRADNNCNGVVDEQTELYDDDGDGYAEVNLDCNDLRDDIKPGATEICDNLDNDCNGLVDDACIDLDSEPYVFGGVNASQTAIEVGQTVQLHVEVYDEDGQDISYAWSADGGTLDNITGQTVTWTAPEELNDDVGDIYRFYVVASDEDQNQTWAFADVVVYQAGYFDQKKTEVITIPAEGCSTTGGGSKALGMLGLVAAFGLLFRRRDEE